MALIAGSSRFLIKAARCAIGFAEPRPDVHSPGFGACEQDGDKQ